MRAFRIVAPEEGAIQAPEVSAVSAFFLMRSLFHMELRFFRVGRWARAHKNAQGAQCFRWAFRITTTGGGALQALKVSAVSAFFRMLRLL